jgi:hypothetical protein
MYIPAMRLQLVMTFRLSHEAKYWFNSLSNDKTMRDSVQYDIIVNGEENNSQPPFEPNFPLMSSDGRFPGS